MAGSGSQPPPAVRRISDDAVRTRTGRTWDEWFALLDGWGATGRTHQEIARWLAAEHGLDGRWGQTVTVGYEQARGLREPGQQCDGRYAANASKTVAVGVDELYAAFADARRRRHWLPDAELDIRTRRPDRLLRARWTDGTEVTATFTAKGTGRSQVMIAHTGLTTAAQADHLKTYWRTAVTHLKQTLEP